MFLPPQYAWFEPVAVAAIVVFFVSWIGNKVTFSNTFLNALATSVVFALIFGVIAYFGFGTVTMTASKSGNVSTVIQGVPKASGPIASEPKAQASDPAIAAPSPK